MKFHHKIIVTSFIILQGLNALPAEGQENVSLRLRALERKMAQLQENGDYMGGPAPEMPVGEEGTVSTSSLRSILSQLDSLRAAVQAAKAEAEEANHKASQLKLQHEKFVADIEIRFQELRPSLPVTSKEHDVTGNDPNPSHVLGGKPGKGGVRTDMGLVIEEASKKKTEGTEEEKASQTSLNPKEEYALAKELYVSGKYKESIKAFKKFLDRHPNNAFSASAAYWLGESQLAIGRPSDAEATFVNAYKKYPKSKKTPENIMGRAKALAALNQKTKACTILNKLKETSDDFTPEAKQALKTQLKKLQCGA